MTIIKRYSLAFKQKVVREYEAGASLSALGRKYGIGGTTTVQKWVKKYGQAGVRHKQMLIQDPSDQEKTKQLKQRVVQLEKLVAPTRAEAGDRTAVGIPGDNAAHPAKRLPRGIHQPAG